MPFMVGLPKIDTGTRGARMVIQSARDIIKSVGAVNFRFACTKQIEIWSIQNKDCWLVSQNTSPNNIKAAVAHRVWEALYAPRQK
jgi:hypothetical protein